MYEEYLEENMFQNIYWFTYGSEDYELSLRLKEEGKLHKNIEVIEMPKVFKIPKIGSYIYSLFLPFLQKKYLLCCELYKTNQTDGSWSAVISKRLYGKKLLYRTGYTISQLENKLKRFNIIVRQSIEFFERLAYKNCDGATVASKHNFDYVVRRYNLDENRLEVLYNFIDRHKFYDFELQREEKIVFIGRLSSEKNILNLIKAVGKTDLQLDIYGSGYLETELKEYVSKHNLKVSFKGNVSNSELPSILNRAKYFALVSEHEGMPKALIEAMACGCLCIGTNVTGINEVIIDNKTGLLARDTTSIEIEKVILKATHQSQSEIDDIKQNAKKYIDGNFTLNSIYEKEKAIIRNLINE
ncbi:glycosyltransferase [Arcobacter sp. CECT 8986]|uniref:glycosyltransferase n=1 Tax=Arcobacter sp. CECT 8986 TaxID=2044507 RepID=UPI0013E98560|nr:glycosyltransferase [Arcobacter sp. CECT 8986]